MRRFRRNPDKYQKFLVDIFESIGFHFAFQWPFVVSFRLLLDLQLLLTWPGDLDFWQAQLPLAVALSLIVLRYLFNGFRAAYFELKVDEFAPPPDLIPWKVGWPIRVSPSGSSVYFPGTIVAVKERLLASNEATGKQELFLVRYESDDHRGPQDEWQRMQAMPVAVRKWAQRGQALAIAHDTATARRENHATCIALDE